MPGWLIPTIGRAVATGVGEEVGRQAADAVWKGIAQDRNNSTQNKNNGDKSMSYVPTVGVITAQQGQNVGNTSSTGDIIPQLQRHLQEEGMNASDAQTIAMRFVQKDRQQQQAQVRDDAAFNSGLMNANQNLSVQRGMALNAQQIAANNVANQLNNLSQARAQNTALIQAGMQAGMAGIGVNR